MAIVGHCSSTKRVLNAFVRGTVTDRFDRNRHLLRSNINVTASCMNDLDATVRYLRDLLGAPSAAGQRPDAGGSAAVSTSTLT